MKKFLMIFTCSLILLLSGCDKTTSFFIDNIDEQGFEKQVNEFVVLNGLRYRVFDDQANLVSIVCELKSKAEGYSNSNSAGFTERTFEILFNFKYTPYQNGIRVDATVTNYLETYKNYVKKFKKQLERAGYEIEKLK